MSGRGVGITGGGGYLGRAMAHLIADAGAIVLIMGRSKDKLLQTANERKEGRGRILPLVGDVKQDEDISRAIDKLVSEAGHVDGWVNNAFAGASGGMLEYSRENLEVAANALVDVMMATQLVAKAIIEAGRPGAIVNISSMYGMVSPCPDLYRDHAQWHNPPIYGAVKAGLIQFTRYAGTHLAAKGIRVNCVTPGAFPVDAVREDRVFTKRLSDRVPMGRVGRSTEVPGAVLYMLSDAASYTTGANLVVDGGWTAW